MCAPSWIFTVSYSSWIPINAEVSMTVLQVGDGENISNLNLFLGFSGFGVDCPDPIV